MAININQDECISCGICADTCPQEALSLGESGIEVDEEKCIECGICVGECPMSVLST